MPDEPREEVGAVTVHVTKNAIHKAVRNILANEMSLDPVAIRKEIQDKAYDFIKTEVADHINKKGYGHAELESWARRAMESRVKEVDKILKEVVKEIVSERIHEEACQVVAALVRDGLQISVGWNRKVKLAVTQAPEKT